MSVPESTVGLGGRKETVHRVDPFVKVATVELPNELPQAGQPRAVRAKDVVAQPGQADGPRRVPELGIHSSGQTDPCGPAGVLLEPPVKDASRVTVPAVHPPVESVVTRPIGGRVR